MQRTKVTSWILGLLILFEVVGLLACGAGGTPEELVTERKVVVDTIMERDSWHRNSGMYWVDKEGIILLNLFSDNIREEGKKAEFKGADSLLEGREEEEGQEEFK